MFLCLCVVEEGFIKTMCVTYLHKTSVCQIPVNVFVNGETIFCGIPLEGHNLFY